MKTYEVKDSTGVVHSVEAERTEQDGYTVNFFDADDNEVAKFRDFIYIKIA